MIVTCSHCTTRLQLDDAKLPSRPFSVRCPKCQQIINAQPPSMQKSGGALDAVGDLPVSARSQQEMTMPVQAPPIRNEMPPEDASAELSQSPAQAQGSSGDDVLSMLAALLQRQAAEPARAEHVTRKPAWERRRVLICASYAHRNNVATSFAGEPYQLCVAEDTSRAIEQMREEKTDVVVLDPEFDAVEQGAAFISREINAMRMAERRRLVFVLLSPTARTGDPHAAFLSNVNLVVNTADIKDLPRALEKNIRELNDLYRNFHKALNVAEV